MSHMQLPEPLQWIAEQGAQAGVVALELSEQYSVRYSAFQHEALPFAVESEVLTEALHYVREHGTAVPDEGGLVVLEPVPGTVLSLRERGANWWLQVNLAVTSPGVDECVRQGFLPPLAARLLVAALHSGKNILLMGPQQPCWYLAQALAPQHGVGALVTAEQALPPQWLRFEQDAPRLPAALHYYVHFAGLASQLMPFMLQHQSAIGWLAASRLDRGLMRYEACAGDVDGPLAVPAGVDLVVVVAKVMNAYKMVHMAELVLAAPAYRPQPLFQLHNDGSGFSTLPVGAPAFLDDLRLLGHDAVADELLRAIPQRVRAAQPAAAAPPVAKSDASAATRSDFQQPIRASQGRAELEESDAHLFTPPSDVDEHDPGWELELMMERGVEFGAAEGGRDAESQELAASFGLGPPPRPSGMKVPATTEQAALYSYPSQHVPAQVDLDVMDHSVQTEGGPHGTQTEVEQVTQVDDDAKRARQRSFQDIFEQRRKR